MPPHKKDNFLGKFFFDFLNDCRIIWFWLKIFAIHRIRHNDNFI